MPDQPDLLVDDVLNCTVCSRETDILYDVLVTWKRREGGYTEQFDDHYAPDICLCLDCAKEVEKSIRTGIIKRYPNA